MNVTSSQPQNQLTQWANLTPQQKMAMALLQSSQNGLSNVNQQGAISPMQGLSSMANSFMGAQLLNQQGQMNQQQQAGQMGNSVSPYALQNANSSQDPIGALALSQGWTGGQ